MYHSIQPIHPTDTDKIEPGDQFWLHTIQVFIGDVVRGEPGMTWVLVNSTGDSMPILAGVVMSKVL